MVPETASEPRAGDPCGKPPVPQCCSCCSSLRLVSGLWKFFPLCRSDPKSVFHFRIIPLTFSSIFTDASVSDRIHAFILLSLYITVPCSIYHGFVLPHNTASCLKLRRAAASYLQHLLKCSSLAVLSSVLLPNGQHYLDVTWKLSLQG